MKKKKSGIAIDIVQRLAIALVTGLIAALIAALLAFIICTNFLPKAYVSNFSFTVKGAGANTVTITDSLKTPGFSEKVASYLSENGETTIYENVYKKIEASLSSGKEMITVTAVSEEDAKEAFRIADGAEKSIQDWIGSNFGTGAEINVISHANLPSSSETRNINTYVILSAIAVGLIVFAVTALALNLSDTINDSSQIVRRYNVELLADIPFSAKPLEPVKNEEGKEN